jgi:two-component system KDP operon response regulator KdpE
MKVLIVEDSQDIIDAVNLAFQIRWPEAQVISTKFGEKGIELVETEKPDMVILDLGLPDVSGFDVLKGIRLFSQVPVIIMTVRGEEPDIVKGLEWGADDYIVKPFRQLELLSRVKAIVRRQSSQMSEMQISAGTLSLNPDTGQMTLGDKEITLTPTESRIMRQLMKNPGQTVTHSILADAIWGDNYPDASDAIKVYIRRLREKLEADPSNPKIILTRAGIGYVLEKPE